MGKTKGPYQAEFAVGTRVRIADLRALEEFKKTWRFHNPLQPQQLQYAGRQTEVEKVSFYHGADELYELREIPGLWHEQCLVGLDEV